MRILIRRRKFSAASDVNILPYQFTSYAIEDCSIFTVGLTTGEVTSIAKDCFEKLEQESLNRKIDHSRLILYLGKDRPATSCL